MTESEHDVKVVLIFLYEPNVLEKLHLLISMCKI